MFTDNMLFRSIIGKGPLEGSGFNSSVGAQQMLMHRKSCLIPILKAGSRGLFLRLITAVACVERWQCSCCLSNDSCFLGLYSVFFYRVWQRGDKTNGLYVL